MCILCLSENGNRALWVRIYIYIYAKNQFLSFRMNKQSSQLHTCTHMHTSHLQMRACSIRMFCIDGRSVGLCCPSKRETTSRSTPVYTANSCADSAHTLVIRDYSGATHLRPRGRALYITYMFGRHHVCALRWNDKSKVSKLFCWASHRKALHDGGNNNARGI